MQSLQRFWHSGWGLDWLYDRLFVRPYDGLAALLKGDPVDAVHNLIVAIYLTLNDLPLIHIFRCRRSTPFWSPCLSHHFHELAAFFCPIRSSFSH